MNVWLTDDGDELCVAESKRPGRAIFVSVTPETGLAQSFALTGEQAAEFAQAILELVRGG
jgi:hypothetical protein